MPEVELTKEQRKRSIAEARGKIPQSPWALSFMVLLGMVISGLIERSSYPTVTPDSVVSFPGMPARHGANATIERRYCDPPNMTILVMYETLFDSEEEILEGDYDYLQMEEMDFQVEFSPDHEKSQWRWQAFLWGSLLAPVPASLLACFVGPGRVFGCCILLAGVAGLLIPQDDFAFQAVVVYIQGAIYGCLQPCAILLASSSPSEEKRTMFLAILSGSKLGFGLAEIIPGHLRSFTTCILGVTWFATWVLILNTPKLSKKKYPIPWRNLLTARIVWMAVIAVIGTELIQATTAYAMRQYIHIVYNYTNWFFIALPNGFNFGLAFLCAYVSNAITKSEKFSKTTTRRIFVYISHFLPAGILFVSAFVGCDHRAPVVLYTLAITLGGAAYSGAFANVLDVAPNFPAPVVALTCTGGAIARLLPVLLTTLIYKGLMPGSWRLTLSLGSLVALVTAIIFMLRSSSRPASWNYPDMPKPPKSAVKLTLENCLLSVLATKEPERFTRARACSTSVATNIYRKRLLTPKRASIS